MKISIVFHSTSGNTERVARLIASGAEAVTGIEVKIMSVEALDENFLAESRAVVVGSPTVCGSFSWQLKKWLDTTQSDLAGKLGAVFMTEGYLGGGADAAELALAGHLLVRGMLVYSAGFTQPGPITHFGAVCIQAGDEFQQNRAVFLGRRVAEKAMELFQH